MTVQVVDGILICLHLLLSLTNCNCKEEPRTDPITSLLRIPDEYRHRPERARPKAARLDALPDTELPFGYEGILSYRDVYYLQCDQKMYEETSYKKAWDESNKAHFEKAAELLRNFTTVDRLGKSDEWRVAVCDGYPLAALQCSPHPTAKTPICQCLETRWTKLAHTRITIKEIHYGNGTDVQREINTCRVLLEHRCEPKNEYRPQWYPFECAPHVFCVSNVCRTNEDVAFSLQASSYLLTSFFVILALLY